MVVTGPGREVDGATIVIRDGFIQAVGPGVAAPADARVHDMKGATIYAGFIEPWLTLDSTNGPAAPAGGESVADGATSGARGVNFFGVSTGDRERAGPGYEVAQVTPENRAVRSLSLDKAAPPLRELGFTAANVVPGKGIVRGSSALAMLSEAPVNEKVLRADTWQHVAMQVEPGRDGAYPRSLMGVIALVRQTFFDARHDANERAVFSANPGGRRRPEYNPALEALAPAAERRMPVVFEPGSVLMEDRAARVARELELTFYLLASGQEWRRPDLVAATGAPFIVPLHFPELPRMPEEEDWDSVGLDTLRAWDWAPENPALLRRQGLEMALTTHGLSDRRNFRANLRLAMDRGLSEADALAALTTVPAKLCGVEDRLGTIEAGKIANLTVVAGGGYFAPDNRVREVWIDGRAYPVTGAERSPAERRDPAGTAAGGETDRQAEEKKKKQEALRELRKGRVARSPTDGRGPMASPGSVLVEGATVWTCGPQGRLENADVLVEGGKVKAVGRGLRSGGGLGPSTLVIDARGRHLTPGLVDAHNHSLVLGAVNEGTLPSTAMVRIGDVINSESIHIHRQLAGGLTTLNLLHGSANPIGGQNAILKLRDGAGPEEMKLEGAPPGIKFALGENVKQSNWGDRSTNRFPQTRMGVRTFLANRFSAAREYLRDWENYEKAPDRDRRAAPRRNLELEALGEVLQGRRWIHCHSYRQDEVLAFLRTMESFGVKVGTLQHILEGYKVADEIARHGAGASTFADWWAYKFEVYDAIPYNGSLMRERGVLVSFNSDSSDLSRRLSLEAAKAVKYGGTPEEEALRFVTLNPARQLRIESRVGSLEPGKDGDFVLWSRSPLDSTTVCLQTWIEGKKYFDRDAEPALVGALEQERTALLEKAKKIVASGGGGEAGDKAKERFFELPLEHREDGRDRHCMEED